MWLKIGYPNIPKLCDLFFFIIFSFKRSFSVGTRYPVKRHTPKSVSCTQKSGRGLNWSYFLGNSEALHFEPQAANMDARIWVLDGFGTVGQQRRLENSERVWNEYIYIYMNEKNVQLCHGTDGKGKGSAEFCVCFSGNDVIHPPSGESLLQHYLGS